MSAEPVVSPTQRPAAVIKEVHPAVIKEVLALGWQDFTRAPWFGLFFGLVYASGGWTIFLLAAVSGYYYLAYPLAAGFALIAPFVAAGLYEVSRSLETDVIPDWTPVLKIVLGAGSRDLGWMALITGFVFFIWLDIAFFLYAIFFGFQAVTLPNLFHAITTTWTGFVFFLTGNLVGAAIAFFVFSISAVSFPMLLDRDIDFVTAMITSTRLVRRNPQTMILWAATIAFLLLISALTLLAGLVLVLPLLGHASWHMYRRTVA